MREHQDEWIVAYQETQGDLRDEDTPSGRMRALYRRLYDLLSFNLLSRYHSYLNKIKDARQLEAAA